LSKRNEEQVKSVDAKVAKGKERERKEKQARAMQWPQRYAMETKEKGQRDGSGLDSLRAIPFG
jgi:hypothetical protein